MGTFENKLNDFETFLMQQEKAENTVEKYIRDIKEFYNWLKNLISNVENINGTYISQERIIANEEVKCEILTKEIVIKYKEYLKEKHKDKITSINSKISSLNSFFIFIERQELTLKIIKCQKSLFGRKEKELTKEDLDKLLIAAGSDERLFYLIETIATTGIRVSEVKSITVEALRNKRAVVNNKGKVREVHIPSKLCEILLMYCKKHNISEGAVFTTRNGKVLHRSYIWVMLKSLCKKANVDEKKVFPHNLRHFFAREFYRETKDIVKLATILGHSSIETTRIYTLENEDEIVKAIENLQFIQYERMRQ